jgi:hypothetical protein
VTLPHLAKRLKLVGLELCGKKTVNQITLKGALAP